MPAVPAADDALAQDAVHRAVLESALDCIVTMDAAGRIVEFNPAAERTFGRSRDEVIGHDMAEIIVPPSLRPRHRAGLAGHLAGGPPRVLDRRIEIAALRADGTEFPVELTITRIERADGPLFVGHIRDITDRKLAEAELRRSRGRLVEAADAARRRIERDLHDGAQQQLVALSLDLRVARSLLAQDPGGAAAVLDEMGEHLAEAIEDLRNLARGIHPAVLTEQGLRAALRLLVRRAPIAVEVLEVPEERLPAAVEATAYFLVSEGLTNAVRHAGAANATVSVRLDGGDVVVEVSDDGAGGARLDGGSGLRGLVDRVAALDGTLEIESPPGAGTTLCARIPCAS